MNEGLSRYKSTVTEITLIVPKDEPKELTISGTT